MSLFPEITSKNHEEYIEGVLVSYKYFVNAQDVWWYCFDDIVEFIRMNEKYANMLYDKEVPEVSKEIFEDWNYYNDYGVNQSKARRFVTSEVVRQFIERNNQRNNILIKSMNNLEFKEDAHEKYFEDDELLDIMNKTKTALENKDYEEWAIQVNKAFYSESFRDIGNKIGILDKDKEKVVDKIREEIYKDEIDWILAGSGEEEIIKVYVSYGDAEEEIDSSVDFWATGDGLNRHQRVDDVTYGDITWFVETYTWGNDDSDSCIFYTDAGDGYYIEVNFFLMAYDSEEVVKMMESFTFEENPSDKYYEFLDTIYGE